MILVILHMKLSPKKEFILMHNISSEFVKI